MSAKDISMRTYLERKLLSAMRKLAHNFEHILRIYLILSVRICNDKYYRLSYFSYGLLNTTFRKSIPRDF